jgi:Fe-Mn family superoxide dismutase
MILSETDMPDISRRRLAAGVGLLAGAAAMPASAQPLLAAATASKVRAQPLTFNPDKIKWLSAQAITEHHAIYGESVNRLNAVTEQLAQIDLAKAPPAEVGELKREQQGVYNSSLLHELYFECIGDAPTRPSGVFAQAISRDFTSFDRWKAEFAAMGKAMTDGKGLVILAYTPRDKRLINHLAVDHAAGPAGCVPLIVMDMYEHAYKRDFDGNPAKYVDSFVQMLRWVTPERLYREAIRV